MFAYLPNPIQVGLKETVDGRRLRARNRSALRLLGQEAKRLSRDCLTDVHNLEDWSQRRALTRHQLQTMLGLMPLPDRTPLNALCTGSIERPNYRIEKWLFHSRPSLYVTANLYLPHERPAPLPCILYLNGHWPSLDGAKTGFQDRYLWYPANGFGLLVIDPLGFGEIPGIHHGMNRLNWWHWLSLGYTPAGVEVWNGMRALDWLETLPEVDASRIGVTGISGGGVITQYLSALDDRVAVAAPSCSTYTLGNQVTKNLIPQQCDCTFYPNVFGLDFPEVLALIAPRPLLILGGRKDPIFPPAGFRAAYQRAKHIYDLFPEHRQSDPRLRLVESTSGHTDPPHFLQETRAWMGRWLAVTETHPSAAANAEPTPEPPECLRCAQEPPKGALNASVHDHWIRRRSPVIPTGERAWSERRTALLETLRSKTFGWFPRVGAPFNTRQRPFSGGYAGDLAVYQEFEFDTEPGVPVKVGLLRPRVAARRLPLIVALKGPADHVTFPDIDEFLPLLRTHTIALLTPRFADRPLSAPEHARVERTAACLGRSIAALQVWDVLRTLVWVRDYRQITTTAITLYGREDAGIVGLYAALLEPEVGQVVLRDPPASHLDGPALPLILRDTDLDEVAGLLAPRRLTLIGQRRTHWPVAAAVYGLTGAPQALAGEESLWSAIRADEGPDPIAAPASLDEIAPC